MLCRRFCCWSLLRTNPSALWRQPLLLPHWLPHWLFRLLEVLPESFVLLLPLWLLSGGSLFLILLLLHLLLLLLLLLWPVLLLLFLLRLRRRRSIRIQEACDSTAKSNLRISLPTCPSTHEFPANHWNAHLRPTKQRPTSIWVTLVAPLPDALPRPQIPGQSLLQAVLEPHETRLPLRHLERIFLSSITSPVWRRHRHVSCGDRAEVRRLEARLKTGAVEIPKHSLCRALIGCLLGVARPG
mmetsp:Transcript_71519/g.115416  ORF Transcript_71519/g.115416 Transcript_71519/m.115416 type:complete len:241 (-) Transcript_71519:897-1619(-)